MAAEFELLGVDELTRKLREITPALRKRVLRNALAAGARLVRDTAKKNAPVLGKATPYRTPSLLKNSITVRTSKVARRKGNVGVFVNVRPARGVNIGAKSKLDPFYWRWLEFGWTPASGPRGKSGARERRKDLRAGKPRQIAGRRFLTNASKVFPQALDVIQTALRKWFDKTNATGRVVP
jgi:HK97 gp10 family phage protein